MCIFSSAERVRSPPPMSPLGHPDVVVTCEEGSDSNEEEDEVLLDEFTATGEYRSGEVVRIAASVVCVSLYGLTSSLC